MLKEKSGGMQGKSEPAGSVVHFCDAMHLRTRNEGGDPSCRVSSEHFAMQQDLQRQFFCLYRVSYCFNAPKASFFPRPRTAISAS
jgi:hypothetical protein